MPRQSTGSPAGLRRRYALGALLTILGAGISCGDPSGPGGRANLAVPIIYVIPQIALANNVMSVRVDGLDHRPLVAADTFHITGRPSWSPDRQWLAFFSSYAPTGVTIAKVDGSERRVLVIPRVGWQSAWSADGRQLVVVASSPDGRRDVVRINTDGTGLTTIAQGTCEDAVAWSPDGRRVAIPRCLGPGENTIELIDPDGGNPQSLRITGIVRGLAWSPDGSRIAYTTIPEFAEQPYGLHVVNADGTNAHLVVDSEPYGGIVSPSWSPDGRALSFVSVDPTFQDVFVVSLRTGEVTRVTNGAGASRAVWQR